MQITINRNISQELHCFKIRINLLSKSLRAAIIFFVAGILVITTCQNDFGVTDTSLIIYLFLEMVLFIFSFFIFRQLYRNYKQYKTFSKSALTDYGALETYSTVSIDDKYFCYESVNKYYKFSWPSLYMYQLYKGNLIIMTESATNSFVIKPGELTLTEFNELFAFVSKNLKFKKK
jgi:hypothetical protein